MTDETITIETILTRRKKLEEIQGEGLSQALSSFLQWMFQNYSVMDKTAQTYVDQVVDNFYHAAEKNIAAMPDSAEKRKARRSHAIGEGKHVKSEALLTQLNGPLTDHVSIELEWKKIATDGLQVIIDLLFEVQFEGNIQKAELCSLSLYYNAVDEILAAIHLSSHRYIIQANAHFRTLLETLDRIELFFKDEKWIDVWSGDDQAKIRRELSPGNIRKLLGREKSWDPLYNYYSGLGTHPSFEVFKARALQKEKDPPKTATMFVGGTPLVHLQMFCFGLGLSVIHRLASSIFNHLSRFFNNEDAIQMMDSLVDDQKKFTTEHFIPWALEEGIDVNKLKDSIVNFSFK